MPRFRFRGARLLPLLVLVLAGAAGATPRYAIRAGQNCNLCHTNPTGGGMRELYASQFLIAEQISMKKETEPEIPIDPQIGTNVVIGTDLRTFYLHRDDQDVRNNFLQMQGAVYLSFQPATRFLGYFHQEFGQGPASAYELFALGWVLPGNGYVKAGKFVPAFGWRVPDHRSFTRRDFVFLPATPPHSDTGLEIGVFPGSFAIQASVLNGEYRSSFDSNDRVAFAARGSYRWTGGWGNVEIGGSCYRNQTSLEERRTYGPFAGLFLWRLTWTGEVDWTRVETAAVTTSLTTSHELAGRIVQGIDVFATYDFHDPHTDLKTGSVHRIGLGVDVLPYPFLALRGKVNAFRVDEGVDISALYTEDFLQSQVEIHFFY